MTKAYIAGPISGHDKAAVQEAFYQKAKELRQRGYEVINPVDRIKQINNTRVLNEQHELSDDHPDDRKQILDICLYDLSKCDEMHVLPGWKNSKGVQIELSFAYETGMKVVFYLEN